ncbi:hypothetical protein [Nostoc favosum]|nr:hypothetical protein [Nostoc favosum]
MGFGETLREQVGEPAQRTGFSAPSVVAAGLADAASTFSVTRA